MGKHKTTLEAERLAGLMPSVPAELLEHFAKGPLTAESINSASLALKKALIERALGAELTHHLGYELGGSRPEESANQRNGVSGKTVLTETGPIRLEVPRDREGSFSPLLVGKHERRFTGFDDKIVALYSRGLTVREIQAFLAEQYGTQVSPDLISTVTAAVVTEVGGLAVSGSGADVPGGVFRCAAGEDPRRGCGAQQGGVLGLGRAAGRDAGDPGPVAGDDRGREVLAQGFQ